VWTNEKHRSKASAQPLKINLAVSTLTVSTSFDMPKCSLIVSPVDLASINLIDINFQILLWCLYVHREPLTYGVVTVLNTTLLFVDEKIMRGFQFMVIFIVMFINF
jgi:hypothetical protein